MKEYSMGYCVRRAAEIGFRNPLVGASFLLWALNCPTDIDSYMAQLIKNQPSLFNRDTRRTYGV